MPCHTNQHPPFEDPFCVLPRSTKLYSIWVMLTYPFASKGDDLSIHYTTILNKSAAHRIKLGSSVIIGKDAWLNVPTPPEEAGEPTIIVEDNCRIGHRCQLSGKNCIHLERT